MSQAMLLLWMILAAAMTIPISLLLRWVLTPGRGKRRELAVFLLRGDCPQLEAELRYRRLFCLPAELLLLDCGADPEVTALAKHYADSNPFADYQVLDDFVSGISPETVYKTITFVLY